MFLLYVFLFRTKQIVTCSRKKTQSLYSFLVSLGLSERIHLEKKKFWNTIQDLNIVSMPPSAEQFTIFFSLLICWWFPSLWQDRYRYRRNICLLHMLHVVNTSKCTGYRGFSKNIAFLHCSSEAEMVNWVIVVCLGLFGILKITSSVPECLLCGNVTISSLCQNLFSPLLCFSMKVVKRTRQEREREKRKVANGMICIYLHILRTPVPCI